MKKTPVTLGLSPRYARRTPTSDTGGQWRAAGICPGCRRELYVLRNGADFCRNGCLCG